MDHDARQHGDCEEGVQEGAVRSPVRPQRRLPRFRQGRTPAAISQGVHVKIRRPRSADGRPRARARSTPIEPDLARRGSGGPSAGAERRRPGRKDDQLARISGAAGELPQNLGPAVIWHKMRRRCRPPNLRPRKRAAVRCRVQLACRRPIEYEINYARLTYGAPAPMETTQQREKWEKRSHRCTQTSRSESGVPRHARRLRPVETSGPRRIAPGAACAALATNHPCPSRRASGGPAGAP